ncbi:unnamed protein product, partial [marine sediment metagenome]
MKKTLVVLTLASMFVMFAVPALAAPMEGPQKSLDEVQDAAGYQDTDL